MHGITLSQRAATGLNSADGGEITATVGDINALPAGTAADTVASAESVGPERRRGLVMPLWEAAGTHRPEPTPQRTGRVWRRRRFWSGALAVTVADLSAC
ncbi:hypothetical protein ABZ250_14075 [Streptomyces afghaniensis]|uniref:hypothetical protein n=1 Tax=Streptomyces afghaniensis TaxID=66865 RepID=UPI0033BC1B13